MRIAFDWQDALDLAMTGMIFVFGMLLPIVAGVLYLR